MNRRIAFFVSGVLGATLVAGGILAVLHPSDQATASGPRLDSFIEEALADFAPGAVVKRTEDGLVIENARFAPDKQAEHDRAYAALGAGPSSITCAPTKDVLRCSPVADSQVVAALKAGTDVYGRTAITGVTAGGNVPKVEADGLSCGPVASDGSIECRPVTQVAPPVLPSSDVVIYYDHFDVTFEGSHMVSAAGPRLTVPVAVP